MIFRKGYHNAICPGATVRPGIFVLGFPDYIEKKGISYEKRY